MTVHEVRDEKACLDFYLPQLGWAVDVKSSLDYETISISRTCWERQQREVGMKLLYLTPDLRAIWRDDVEPSWRSGRKGEFTVARPNTSLDALLCR
jgi:hypothetical protein